MTRLEELARRVVDAWRGFDLPNALLDLQRGVEEVDRMREVYADEIQAAQIDCNCDVVQVDNDAFISETDEGVWVSAWVFVSAPRDEGEDLDS